MKKPPKYQIKISQEDESAKDMEEISPAAKIITLSDEGKANFQEDRRKIENVDFAKKQDELDTDEDRQN